MAKKCQYCGQEFSTEGYCLAHENHCDENSTWMEEKKRIQRESERRRGKPRGDWSEA